MRTAHRWLVGLAWVALACSSGGDGPSDPGNGNDETEADIIVANDNFTPATFNASLNQTVVWGWNSGGTLHNVTFDDGVASANLGSGTFQRTFSAAGTFNYHCTIHGAAVMSGVVQVGTSPGTGGNGGGGGTDY